VRLNSILNALRKIAKNLPVVLPVHPRTKANLQQQNSSKALEGLTLLEPLLYLEMQRLQMGAKLILTDPGGMQKEAYFHHVPCITLRDETEWVETVEADWNQLVGANTEEIIAAVSKIQELTPVKQKSFFGNGYAVDLVVDQLKF
jgi:UDP-GlcNAc3NAcA epimerase